MRIAVTGAAGFIGQSLCKKLLETGHSVFGIDNFEPTVYKRDKSRDQLKDLFQHSNFEFCEMNALNLRESDLEDVTVLINLAATPGLLPSWKNFDAYTTSNVKLPFFLSNLCAQIGIHLVHASTSSVYGKSVSKSRRNLYPISPYGITKLAGENLIQAFGAEFGLKWTILRLFSVYGPGQRPDQFYGEIARRVLLGQEVQVTGDGLQSRANAYVEDVVEALLLAATKKPHGAVLDISGPQAVSLLDVISKIGKIAGLDPKISFLPSRPGDQESTLGDIASAREILGWEPKTSLHRGLENLVTYERNNLDIGSNRK